MPALLCLAWAADTNLDLARLRRAPESGRWCLFQQTCLSPCFAFQTSPSQRDRFRQRPSIPTKSLGCDESTLSAENRPASRARGVRPRADLGEVRGHSQQSPSTITDLPEAWRCVTLDLCHILVAP